MVTPTKKKKIMSDEAHLNLSEYVNKQNSRFGEMGNPKPLLLQPLKVIVE